MSSDVTHPTVHPTVHLVEAPADPSSALLALELSALGRSARNGGDRTPR